MSVIPEQIVKRVARLRDLVSKPELNDAFVVINSYDASRDRFNVTTLQKPTEDGIVVTISVKLVNLNVTIDPAEGKARLHKEPLPPVMLLQDFGRYLGQPTNQHVPPSLSPRTTVSTPLVVGPRDDNTVVVFEDYNFSFDGRKDDGCALMCTKGHVITFRRCRFQGMFYGVLIGCKDGAGVEVVDESFRDEPNNPILTGTPKVTFESCLFENCTRPDNCSYGAVVGTDGTAAFLNCLFRNCSGGVLIKQGGKADLIHCTFTDMQGTGVEVPRHGTFNMVHCLIENVMLTGAFAMHGSNFTMTKSKVQGKRGCYSAGLLFCGKKAATVIVDDCIVTDCVFGIKAEFQSVNVTVTNTTIRNCAGIGMAVGDSAVGSVTVNQCTFVGCDLQNSSGAKCVVMVDGVRSAPSTRPAMKCNCGRCGDCLVVTRATKKAGLGTVNCAKCSIAEPTDVKFKSCSQCKNVCYCSRECQKAHWKVHKLECDPRSMLKNV